MVFVHGVFRWFYFECFFGWHTSEQALKPYVRAFQ